MKAVVSLNSGSSSIKFSLFAMEPGGSLQLAVEAERSRKSG